MNTMLIDAKRGFSLTLSLIFT